MKQARKSARRASRTADLSTTSQIVPVPADCSVENIQVLRDQLCAIPPETANVTLDLRPLVRFDAAALQLIFAFARDLSSRGANLLVCGNPPGWQEASRLLGLASPLATVGAGPA